MYKYLLASLCFLACRKTAVNESNPVTIKLSECTDVQRGAFRLQVCFDSLSDSRCPANVMCIWAGYAWVKLSVSEGDKRYSFKLSTVKGTVFPPNDTTINNHRFGLINVLPYPGTGSGLSPRIELQVD